MWKSIENNERNSFLSQLKNLKHAIKLTLLLGLPTMAAWQNTVDTTTVQNNKTQIEVVTNDILSPEKILEKHKITDMKTATIEQLQAAFDEITTLLKSKILKEEQEMPYISLRSEIRRQISRTKWEIELKKSKEDAETAEKILTSLEWKKQ